MSKAAKYNWGVYVEGEGWVTAHDFGVSPHPFYEKHRFDFRGGEREDAVHFTLEEAHHFADYQHSWGEPASVEWLNPSAPVEGQLGLL